MGIGEDLKACQPFGKFSYPIVTPRPRRFSQNWGSGGRVLAYMSYCSTITGVSAVENLRPCKVYEVTAGWYVKWG